jgi:predicted acetyltransferase
MKKLEVEMEVKVHSEKMIDAFADLIKSLINFTESFNTMIDSSKEFSKAMKKLEKSKMTIEVQSNDKHKVKWWKFWKVKA